MKRKAAPKEERKEGKQTWTYSQLLNYANLKEKYTGIWKTSFWFEQKEHILRWVVDDVVNFSAPKISDATNTRDIDILMSDRTSFAC